MKRLPEQRHHRASSDGGRPKERTIYGINPVTEALKAGRRILDVKVAAGKHGPELKQLVHLLRQKNVPVAEVDRHAIATMADSRSHQGVAARVEALSNGSLTGLVHDRPTGPITVLVLDHLQDPQNLGAIFRAADAFGVDLVFLPAHDAASHQLGSVAKASAGAVEHVAAVVVADLRTPLAELKKHGFAVVGMEAEASDPAAGALDSPRLALVLGSEGPGISKAIRGSCDRLVKIPTSGKVGSLNAGMACGIVLYERYAALKA